jgi:hypothetical protein
VNVDQKLIVTIPKTMESPKVEYIKSQKNNKSLMKGVGVTPRRINNEGMPVGKPKAEKKVGINEIIVTSHEIAPSEVVTSCSSQIVEMKSKNNMIVSNKYEKEGKKTIKKEKPVSKKKNKKSEDEKKGENGNCCNIL